VGKSSEAKMEKQVKKSGKGKSKASVAKRVVSKKGKNKRKRETSHVIKPAFLEWDLVPWEVRMTPEKANSQLSTTYVSRRF